MQKSGVISKFDFSVALDLSCILLLWFLGVDLAYWVFQTSGSVFCTLMGRAFSGSVSIVGLLSILIFPFLITVLASVLRKSYPLYMMSFVNGFVYSICSLSVHSYFGSAGWLVHFLLMFSQTSNLVVLLSIWIRFVLNKRCVSLKTIIWGFVLCVVILVIDLQLISPFVALLNI